MWYIPFVHIFNYSERVRSRRCITMQEPIVGQGGERFTCYPGNRGGTVSYWLPKPSPWLPYVAAIFMDSLSTVRYRSARSGHSSVICCSRRIGKSAREHGTSVAA